MEERNDKPTYEDIMKLGEEWDVDVDAGIDMITFTKNKTVTRYEMSGVMGENGWQYRPRHHKTLIKAEFRFIDGEFKSCGIWSYDEGFNGNATLDDIKRHLISYGFRKKDWKIDEDRFADIMLEYDAYCHPNGEWSKCDKITDEYISCVDHSAYMKWNHYDRKQGWMMYVHSHLGEWGVRYEELDEEKIHLFAGIIGLRRRDTMEFEATDTDGLDADMNEGQKFVRLKYSNGFVDYMTKSEYNKRYLIKGPKISKSKPVDEKPKPVEKKVEKKAPVQEEWVQMSLFE